MGTALRHGTTNNGKGVCPLNDFLNIDKGRTLRARTQYATARLSGCGIGDYFQGSARLEKVATDGDAIERVGNMFHWEVSSSC